jgi:chorismate synthase
MAGNTIGQFFRITTAGESHGPANIVIIDGLPAGLQLSLEEIQKDLDRRRPGQSKITSHRHESDEAAILSGLFEGKTTGAPLAILIRNTDQRPGDYDDMKTKYRPGHADFTYDAKYGFHDYRGGGRASARETVSRVAAGAVAKKVLTSLNPDIQILAYVKQVGTISAEIADLQAVSAEQIEASIVRCPDSVAAKKMIELIEQVHKERDSIGGLAEIIIRGVPPGWGEPVFDKLNAELAKALMSIPAVTGVEFGIGFAAATARGSESNDPFIFTDTGIQTASNHHGGIQGGISTGMPILIRCSVKPTSSIPREQQTVTTTGELTTITVKGRHDPCLLPRFIPVAEAMVAIVLADHGLRQRQARI